MPYETFNPSSSRAARALQAWQILIGAASNRQTITYRRLGEMMHGRRAAGVLSQVLGHIAYWCSDRDLPGLNTLVVGTGRGTPGHNIPLEPGVSADEARERVYDVDWYNIRPPSEQELSDAYDDRN